MNYVDKYLESAKRGDFQYECVETTDSYGNGGCKIETVRYKDRYATITRLTSDEFECEIDLLHDPVYIVDYRSSRKNARNFVERIIKNDIENNGKNLKYIKEVW